MAVTFVAEAHASNSGTNATTLACNVPPGTANNDVMVAFTGSSIGTAFVPSAGWTVIGTTGTAGTDVDCKAYFRVASSEPASYTFTGNAVDNQVIQIATFRGVDTAAPMNVAGQSTTVTTQNVTGPTVTSTATGLVLYQRTVRDNVTSVESITSNGAAKNVASQAEVHITAATVNVVLGLFYNTADVASGSQVGSQLNYSQTTPIGTILRTIVLKTGAAAAATSDPGLMVRASAIHRASRW